MPNIKYSNEERKWIRDNCPKLRDYEAHSLFNSTFDKDLSFSAFRKLRQREGVVKEHGRPSINSDST